MSEEVQLMDLAKRSHSRKQRRPHPKAWYRKLKLVYLLYVLIPLIFILAGWGIAVADSLSRVSRSQDDLSILLNSLNNKSATDYTLSDYEELDITISDLNSSLKAINTRTQPIQVLSPLNKNFHVRLQLLEAAIHVTDGARYLLAGLKPTIVFIERGETNQDETAMQGFTFTSTRLVELAGSGGNRFLLAKAELDTAKTILGELELEAASTSTLLEIENLRDYIGEIEAYNDLALEAPELLTVLLGIDRPQTYLILSQNNDEIRPSGGYISTWGWMRVGNGRVEEYQYFPTTATTPAPPPAAFADSYPVPNWWIQFENPVYAAWDGSWYADFAQTAEMATAFYNAGNNPHAPIDGVIGIDLTALEYLMAALGDVTVPEYSTSVGADDLRETVYQIRAEGDAQSEHKKFLSALYTQVIDLWRKADADTRSQINRALLQALQEKHLMLYFVDEKVQNAAVQLNWAGTQSREPFQDYLMVVDANLGNKSSSSVQRHITYDVSLNPDRTMDSHLGIFYNFPASLAENDPAVRPEHYLNQKDYYTILQIFTPPSSQPSEENTDNHFRVVNQSDFNLFTAIEIILYDSSHNLTLDYTNPEAIEMIGSSYRYHLRLDKQPGAVNDSATVSIALPPDATIVSVSPEPDAVYDLGRSVMEFNFVLSTDQSIELLYQLNE